MSYETPGPVETDYSDAVSSIEEIIDDARNGRMFILVDHEDRENEGEGLGNVETARCSTEKTV